MRGSLIACCALLFGFSTLTMANPPIISQNDAQESQKIFCGEKNLREDVDFIIAPIKSAEDLRTYLKIHRKSPSPLDYLSSAARRRFVDSLTFNEKGVTGFATADIEGELTVTEAYQLLALIGAQRVVTKLDNLRVENDMDTAIISMETERQGSEAGDKAAACGTDYQGYKCDSPHTCNRSAGRICLSTC